MRISEKFNVDSLRHSYAEDLGLYFVSPEDTDDDGEYYGEMYEDAVFFYNRYTFSYDLKQRAYLSIILNMIKNGYLKSDDLIEHFNDCSLIDAGSNHYLKATIKEIFFSVLKSYGWSVSSITDDYYFLGDFFNFIHGWACDTSRLEEAGLDIDKLKEYSRVLGRQSYGVKRTKKKEAAALALREEAYDVFKNTIASVIQRASGIHSINIVDNLFDSFSEGFFPLMYYLFFIIQE